MMDKQERDAIIVYRREKAHNTLNEIPVFIENKMWNTAVYRLYYACFYAVNALLLSRYIETKTQEETRRMFGLHFVKNKNVSLDLGNFYAVLYECRDSSEYVDFVDFDKETVEDLYKQAIIFVETIEKLID